MPGCGMHSRPKLAEKARSYSKQSKQQQKQQQLVFSIVPFFNSSPLLLFKNRASSFRCLIDSEFFACSFLLVHRLNIELSRYQAKYRPPRREVCYFCSLEAEF